MKRLAASVLACVIGSAVPAAAQDISGNWVGFGKAKLTKSGKSESFRCRVVYAKAGSTTYNVKAACANPSIRLDQTGQVRRLRNNKFAGSFHNVRIRRPRTCIDHDLRVAPEHLAEKQRWQRIVEAAPALDLRALIWKRSRDFKLRIKDDRS